MRKTGFVLAITMLLFTTLHAQSVIDGKNLYRMGQYNKAIAALRKAPDNAESRYYLGESYFAKGDYDSSSVEFNKGIATDAKFALNYAGLGKVYFMQSKPIEGKASFDQALKLSKDADVYYSIGHFYANSLKGDAVYAITLMEQAQKKNPDEAKFYVIIGDAYMFMKDAGKAVSNYKRAIELNKALAEPYYKVGKIYIAGKNYEEGFNTIQEGLKGEPGFIPFYKELADLYFRSKQYDKAVENFKKFMDGAEKTNDVKYKYAAFLFMNKNYDETIGLLKQLEKEKYSNQLMNRVLGYSLFEKADFAGAKIYMDKFFADHGKEELSSTDYMYYGKILLKTGEEQKGLENLEKAISMDSENQKLYTEMGDYFAEKSMFDKAVTYYEKSVSVGNPNANDYFKLGKASFKAKNYGRADSAFTKVIELSPKDVLGYLYKSRVAVQQDLKMEKDEAATRFEKYVELASANEIKNKDGLIEAYSYLFKYYEKKAMKTKMDEVSQKLKALQAK